MCPARGTWKTVKKQTKIIGSLLVCIRTIPWRSQGARGRPQDDPGRPRTDPTCLRPPTPSACQDPFMFQNMDPMFQTMFQKAPESLEFLAFLHQDDSRPTPRRTQGVPRPIQVHPKTIPGRSRTTPGRTQDAPGGTQDDPRTVQDDPLGASRIIAKTL